MPDDTAEGMHERVRRAIDDAECSHVDYRNVYDDCSNCVAAAIIVDVLPEHERQVRERVAKEQAAWLPEILHVVWGFAMREHEGTPQLVPAHAEEALRHVPGAVLDAARVARGES